MQIMKDSPFRDSAPDRIFGPRAEVFMSPDLSEVTVPLWSVAPTTHISNIHQLGANPLPEHADSAQEAGPVGGLVPAGLLSGIRRPTQGVLRLLAQGRSKRDHGHPADPTRDPHRRRLVLHPGGEQVAIARTEYPRWYFDARPSDWVGDGKRADFMRLANSETIEAAEAKLFGAGSARALGAGG